MPQFVRAMAAIGKSVRIVVDGNPLSVTAGDSVLAAMLLHGSHLRLLEFGGEPRAGFCLMGACQDCWVWTETGERLRACSTPVAEGMRLTIAAPFPLEEQSHHA